MRLIALLLLTSSFVQVSAQSIQEQLGYPANSKLLIIHADDIGVSHSENAATIKAFEEGLVVSGSAMVPCPWFPDFAAWARANPEADIGLHLTLTSEWKNFKWGPVTSKIEVPTLLDSLGNLLDGRDARIQDANIVEVENELRAQIERAITLGIDITHLDPHMFVLFGRKDYLELLIKLGEELKVPVLLSRDILSQHYDISAKDVKNEYPVLIDSIYGAGPEDYENGLANYYEDALRSIEPGINYLLIHTAYDNEEMKAVTSSYDNWGSAWRQDDFDFFTSERCRKILQEENIILITWRQIRDEIIRKDLTK